eukprot:scaffold90428_cov38-Phaeocystis_antarctica.AAC.2
MRDDDLVLTGTARRAMERDQRRRRGCAVIFIRGARRRRIRGAHRRNRGGILGQYQGPRLVLRGARRRIRSSRQADCVRQRVCRRAKAVRPYLLQHQLPGNLQAVVHPLGRYKCCWLVLRLLLQESTRSG